MPVSPAVLRPKVADGAIVFNGADDDGSGTVALIEIADAYALAAAAGQRPRRSVLFACWGSEERSTTGPRRSTTRRWSGLPGWCTRRVGCWPIRSNGRSRSRRCHAGAQGANQKLASIAKKYRPMRSEFSGVPRTGVLEWHGCAARGRHAHQWTTGLGDEQDHVLPASAESAFTLKRNSRGKGFEKPGSDPSENRHSGSGQRSRAESDSSSKAPADPSAKPPSRSPKPCPGPGPRSVWGIPRTGEPSNPTLTPVQARLRLGV